MPVGKSRWGDEDTQTSKKWADEDDDLEESSSSNFSTKDVPQEDGSILRTVIEYKTNEKNQQIKVTRTYKVTKKQIRMNKKVEERRKWRKFGEARDAGPGPEDATTSLSLEEMYLEYSNRPEANADKAAASSKVAEKGASLGITCRNCGRDHWTSKCPYGKNEALLPTKKESVESGVGSIGGGKYQPPGKGLHSSGASFGDEKREEVATVRVANLSEDTKESDLAELFRNFGPISRIYLAKDKVNGSSRGFAYVNFLHKEDAARAIQKLSGYGYDHLILHLEWAKPSNK